MLGAWLALTVPPHSVSADTPPTTATDRQALDKLVARLKVEEGGTIAFRETRHFQRFKAPVVLSGTLAYTAPDRLVRTVEAPRFERTEVSGERLSIRTRRDGPARTGRLADFPTLEGLIDVLRAVLGGNAPALHERFVAGLVRSSLGWTIRLLPRSASVQKRVTEILVTGQKETVRSLTLRLSDGDRIVIELAP